MPVPRMSPITKNSSSFGPIARLSSGWAVPPLASVMRSWCYDPAVRHAPAESEPGRHTDPGRGPVAPERREHRDHDERQHDHRDPADRRRRARARSPAAAGPCHRSASRGPPATTTMNTPCIRPRISSVATVCSIEDRYTELTRSPGPGDAPAPARPATASRPARTARRRGPTRRWRPSPPRPGAATRCSQPENSPAATIPIGIAANSSPSAMPPPGGSPNTVCDISGNTTRGIPNAHRHDVDEERHQQDLVHAPRSGSPSAISRRPARRCGARRASRAAPRAAARWPTAWRAARSRRAGRASAARSPGSGRPRAAGRRSRPIWTTVMFSAFAAGSWSAGSSRGQHGAAGGLVDRQERGLHGEQRQDRPRPRRCRWPR